jgi:hypothetical protein
MLALSSTSIPPPLPYTHYHLTNAETLMKPARRLRVSMRPTWALHHRMHTARMCLSQRNFCTSGAPYSCSPIVIFKINFLFIFRLPPISLSILAIHLSTFRAVLTCDCRCPAWCDRVLMNAPALMSADPRSYQLVGAKVCMGDHKPVSLQFALGDTHAAARISAFVVGALLTLSLGWAS